MIKMQPCLFELLIIWILIVCCGPVENKRSGSFSSGSRHSYRPSISRRTYTPPRIYRRCSADSCNSPINPEPYSTASNPWPGPDGDYSSEQTPGSSGQIRVTKPPGLGEGDSSGSSSWTKRIALDGQTNFDRLLAPGTTFPKDKSVDQQIADDDDNNQIIQVHQKPLQSAYRDNSRFESKNIGYGDTVVTGEFLIPTDQQVHKKPPQSAYRDNSRFESKNIGYGDTVVAGEFLIPPDQQVENNPQSHDNPNHIQNNHHTRIVNSPRSTKHYLELTQLPATQESASASQLPVETYNVTNSLHVTTVLQPPTTAKPQGTEDANPLLSSTSKYSNDNSLTDLVSSTAASVKFHQGTSQYLEMTPDEYSSTLASSDVSDFHVRIVSGNNSNGSTAVRQYGNFEPR